jgi:hypothetical protein
VVVNWSKSYFITLHKFQASSNLQIMISMKAKANLNEAFKELNAIPLVFVVD